MPQLSARYQSYHLRTCVLALYPRSPPGIEIHLRLLISKFISFIPPVIPMLNR